MIIITLFLITLIFLFFVLTHKKLWYNSFLVAVIIILCTPLYFPWRFNYCLFSFFLDPLSFFLLYLSFFTLTLIILRRNKIYKFNKIKFLFLIIIFLLSVRLLFSFSVDSVLSFYFFFEFSLIPTIFLIIGWGYQIERIQATIYFLIYTLFASLPILLFILKIETFEKGFYFRFMDLLFVTNTPGLFNYLMIWSSIGAFLVKLPIFLFHLWLPKAHVEAPVRGSIILAGVLLKLGGYGLIRVTPLIIPIISGISWSIFSLRLISIIYISLRCLRSNDIKSLIAYSSVAHMSICLCGVITIYFLGLKGGVLMLLGHGLCSSGLFRYVNILYERTGSRSVIINKGVITYTIISGLFIFILSVYNIGAPPSINLFRELFLISRIICFRTFNIFVLLLGAFLVACYCMFIFSSSHHGKIFFLINRFSSFKEIEYLILHSHIFPLTVSFIFINLV